MKDKTIDYILRATWQAVAECIMKKRRNMMRVWQRICFIEYRQGRWNAIDSLGPKMGWKQQA
jgi:hypothetical protein